MIKKYKKTLIITSILILLPILAGLLLWNQLPDTSATHFGADKHIQETFFQLTWINFNTDNNQCIFYCLIRHTEDPSKII